MNNALALLAAMLMGLSKVAWSYEMLIIGRVIIGINCGQFYSQEFFSPVHVTCPLTEQTNKLPLDKIKCPFFGSRSATESVQ